MASAEKLQTPDSVVDDGASLGVRRLFTIPGRDPFAEIEWETRDAHIPGKDKPAFEQKDVEFPKFWSQTATNIVAQKYFRGRLGSPEREQSVKQMIGRVVTTIGTWGRDGGYFADEEEAVTFEDELKAILVNQLAAFNSPVWFNVGFEEKPQCSACFILSIDDSMESILDWIRREGVIFRGGSGSGVNLSTLRSSKEQLSKGGYASGPVSFMRGADASAGTIKSGGKTRRAAKMVVLDVDHPDVEEFIWCKAREEEKARVLEAAGYDMSLDSPDWGSIQYQNANNSVRVTDSFMEAVANDAEWNLTARTDGAVVETVQARKLLHDMAEAAWRCADPGVQYDTTINQWHTCPNTGRINASNPCSEYMHIDDSACNLASLNLMKFRREDGEFDIEAFEHAVDTVFLAQEILVGFSSYPTAEIERERGGLPAARARLREPRRAADGARAPVRLGRGSRVLRRDHRADDGPRVPQVGRDREADGAVRGLPAERRRDDRRDGAAPRRGREHRERRLGSGRARDGRAEGVGRRAERRRGQRLPERAGDRPGSDGDDQLHDGLRHDGRRAGLLAREVEEARRRRRAHDGQQDRPARRSRSSATRRTRSAEISAYIEDKNSIVGAPYVKPEHYPVFDCAIGERSIHYMGHVTMMGAVQPFISGAISKTVNMPEQVTVDDVAGLLTDAWKLGVKAIAIYRDNCKVAQPLSGKAEKGATTLIAPAAVAAGVGVAAPRRRRLPEDRVEVGRKFRVGDYEGYIHVGLFEDGTPGDIFVDIAKEGTTLAGLMNSFMISVSLGLQYGVPLEVYVSKFSHMRFEPSGITNDEDIRVAKSIVDYIFRWMGKKFLTTDQQEEAGILSPEVKARMAAAYAAGGTAPAVNEAAAEVATPGQTALFNQWDDAVECARCGGRMVRTGSCYTCRDCGTNTGCS